MSKSDSKSLINCTSYYKIIILYIYFFTSKDFYLNGQIKNVIKSKIKNIQRE